MNDSALSRAKALHRAGNFAAAEPLYRELCAAEPDNGVVHQLLGMVLVAKGDLIGAETAYTMASHLTPDDAILHANLADVLQRNRKLPEALAAIDRATALAPDMAAVWFNRATILEDLGRLEAAVDSLDRVLSLDANHADALFNRGLIGRRLGDLKIALESFDRVIEIDPRRASAWSTRAEIRLNTGNMAGGFTDIETALALKPDSERYRFAYGLFLAQMDRVDEAEALVDSLQDEAYRLALLGMIARESGDLATAAMRLAQACAAAPTETELLNICAVSLFGLRRLPEAIGVFKQIVEIDPGHVVAWTNLGAAYNQADQHEEALEALERAVAVNPRDGAAWTNLGVALTELGRVSEAVVAHERALQVMPFMPNAWNNYGYALQRLDRHREAIEAMRRSVELYEGNPTISSNILMALHYIHDCPAEDIFEEHLDWDRRYAQPLRPAVEAHNNDPDPDRRLNIGMISGSFLRHPVSYLTLPFIESYDHDALSITAYMTSHRRSDLTERIQTALDEWMVVAGLPDDDIARMIKQDGIDILIDLSGHSADNRLLVLARRPAPIQIKWVGGLFNTTGIKAVDYLITDALESPPGSEPFYVEELLRLPDGYIVYEPPHYAPDVGPLPALANGHVTFACFNNSLKLNPPLLGLWARIMNAVPNSRLLLKFRPLRDEEAKRRFRRVFEEVGGDPSRVDFEGHSPHSELMATYNRVDIALDCHPYSGGLTTVEALWMGVPVVTMPGPTFAGRHSATHLNNAGLADWIADGPDAYVARAVAAASDLPALAELRGRLRPQMAASPLCDGPRFARNLEAALRGVWQRWCDQRKTA